MKPVIKNNLAELKIKLANLAGNKVLKITTDRLEAENNTSLKNIALKHFVSGAKDIYLESSK